MSFSTLKDIIDYARKVNPEFSKRLNESKVLGFWEDAVGPHIAKHTQLISVKEGTLIISVDHPVWKSELFLRKNQILEKLSALPDLQGERIIKDLYFIDLSARDNKNKIKFLKQDKQEQKK